MPVDGAWPGLGGIGRLRSARGPSREAQPQHQHRRERGKQEVNRRNNKSLANPSSAAYVDNERHRLSALKPMTTLKSSRALLAVTATLASLAAANPAHAILTYFIYQSGSDVVVAARGSLNLPSPLSTTVSNVQGTLYPAIGQVSVGSSPSYKAYSVTGPAQIEGNAIRFANSNSGIFTAIKGGNSQAWIASSYNNGDVINSTSIHTGTTLAGLGFTSTGQIGTWTLATTNDKINVVIGAPTAFSAPVPAPLPLLGAGAAFGWSRRLRRRVALRAASRSRA